MKSTGDLRIRLSKAQKQHLRLLAEAQGYRTLSDFVRFKIFDKDLGTHMKLNEILKILKEKL
jgi:hypothetical protein